METPSPYMVIRVSGPYYQAFVVIDSVFNETCSGGVRIIEDVQIEEVKQLAAEMTLKYSFFQLGRGGAKAGISLEAGISSAQRNRALRDFGCKMGVLIRAGIYNPGMDMNCGPDDLRAIYAGAGVGIGSPTDTSYFTAVSVSNALRSVAGFLQAGSCSLSIAGFGRVGSYLAARLPAPDFRLVAVSTLSGAIRSSSGFDSQELIEARTRWGDDFIAHVSGESISPEELMTEEVDILVPAARTEAVTLEIAKKLRARAIVPIANYPYGLGALDVLHAAGVVCLPGYLVNGGGVLGSSLFDLGISRAKIDEFFEDFYRPAIEALLDTSAHGNRPVHVLVEAIARYRARSRSTAATGRSLSQKIEGKLRKRYPKALRRKRATSQYRRALSSVISDLRSSENPQ